jgi:hypothetical protein
MPDENGSRIGASARLADLAERLPMMREVLNRIDSRRVFRTAASAGLRYVGHFFLVAFALSWFLSFERLSRALDRADGFGDVTLLISLLAFPVIAVYVWGLVQQRARRLEESEIASVWPVAIHLAGLATEVTALSVLASLSLKGIFTFLGGLDGGGGYDMALWLLGEGVDNLSELFESDSELLSRIGGLVLLVVAVAGGFFVLLGGYLFRDLIRLVYNYLRRRDEVD